MFWVLKPASGKRDSNPALRKSGPALCTMEHTPLPPRVHEQEAREPGGENSPSKAPPLQSFRTNTPGGIARDPSSAPRRENFQAGASGHMRLGWEVCVDLGHPLFPQFAAQIPRRNLQTPSRPTSAAPQHSPAGHSSPPPRESQLCQDPEINLESLARLLELRLLPGRSRAGGRLPWKPRPWLHRVWRVVAPPNARSLAAPQSRRTLSGRQCPWRPPRRPSYPSRQDRAWSLQARTCGSRSARVGSPGLQRGGTRQAEAAFTGRLTVLQVPDVCGLLGSRATGPPASPFHGRGN